MKKVRYNIKKSFEDNKKNGPFGYDDVKDVNKEIEDYLKKSNKEYDFFGFKTKLPIGVAAGSLFNKRYMKAAAKDGFTVITWKTFRSEFRLAHKNNGDFLGHNIVFVHNDRQLTENDILKDINADLEFPEDVTNISITNSFGMGSDEPNVWRKEVKEVEKRMNKHNKQTIASVVASPKPDWTIEMIAQDYASIAKISEESGARIVELNLSCPNVSANSCGKEGSIYNFPEDAKIICKTVKKVLDKKTILLVKIGYSNKEYYRTFLNTIKEYIDGVVAINAIQMKVYDNNGKQALPGGLISGVCGNNILNLSTEAVRYLKEVVNEEKLDLKVIGCGGVTNPEGFFRHLEAGADFVMCATGALFNPKLPLQIAKEIKNKNKTK